MRKKSPSKKVCAGMRNCIFWKYSVSKGYSPRTSTSEYKRYCKNQANLMKSMATLIFEMLQRFANCIGFVRNLSHDSPSSADTAPQSQNCQLDTKRFPGMRKVCERYAKGMRKVWPPRPPAGRAAPPRESWRPVDLQINENYIGFLSICA